MNENLLDFILSCKNCNQTFKIKCTKEQFKEYMKGEKKIQSIFPELTPEIRELLISNTCGKCFDGMFEIA